MRSVLAAVLCSQILLVSVVHGRFSSAPFTPDDRVRLEYLIRFNNARMSSAGHDVESMIESLDSLSDAELIEMLRIVEGLAQRRLDQTLRGAERFVGSLMDPSSEEAREFIHRVLNETDGLQNRKALVSLYASPTYPFVGSLKMVGTEWAATFVQLPEGPASSLCVNPVPVAGENGVAKGSRYPVRLTLGNVEVRDIPEGALFSAMCEAERSVHFLLMLAVREDAALRWRSDLVAETEWTLLESSVADTVEQLAAAYCTRREISLPTAEEIREGITIETKLSEDVPGFLVTSQNDLELVEDVSAILYRATGDGTFAMAGVTSRGLAMMSELGDGDGILWSPLVGNVIVPANPEAFVKNTVNLMLDPGEQLEVVGGSIEDAIALLGGTESLATQMLDPTSVVAETMEQIGLDREWNDLNERVEQAMKEIEDELEKQWKRETERAKKEAKRILRDIEDFFGF